MEYLYRIRGFVAIVINGDGGLGKRRYGMSGDIIMMNEVSAATITAAVGT
jgi:hypothetical protein